MISHYVKHYDAHWISTISETEGPNFSFNPSLVSKILTDYKAPIMQ